MKKSLLAIIVMLTMLMPMLLATGCARNSNRAGMDYYSKVPKVEHERRFPQGHEQVPGPKGEDCVYNEKAGAYFCQYDWFE